MILPTKRLKIERSILGYGGEILTHLNGPKPVSQIWDEIKKTEIQKSEPFKISFDWFVLSLDFLYLLGIIEINDGIIKKVKP